MSAAAETVRFDLATPADIRFGAGRAAELPDPLRARLGDLGIESTAFGVEGEPSIEICRAALDRLRQTGGDAVVGFGGGSALDVAKAVAVLATSRTDPLD